MPEPLKWSALFYIVPGKGSKYCDKRVCVFVCLSATYLKTTRPNFTKFSVHVTCSRGSVLFWRQCYTSCTSGFVGDVMISCNAGNGPDSRIKDDADISSSSSDGDTGGEACRLWLHLVTGPPNGPVLFCTLSSVGVCRRRLSVSSVVVCNARGRSAGRARGRSGGRHCTAGQYGYVPLGRHLVMTATLAVNGSAVTFATASTPLSAENDCPRVGAVAERES